jgi:serine protease AprX
MAAIAREHPGWRREDGACPACVQQALLETLLAKGDAAFHDGVQGAWPLDSEAVFGALPTPLRLHADPRFLGRGVTLALADAGFFPHPDLVAPRNRIRAWIDAGEDPVRLVRFSADEPPLWPGWNALADHQWHGLMTSVVAAGNGQRSRGLYRGLAPEAELVLVQVRDAAGRITNASIARALGALLATPELGVRVVSLSCAGDPVEPLRGNPVDAAIAELTAAGVFVVAAAGNDGERRLVPPATAPEALTVGGLDDRNTLDHAALALWHSSYGESSEGRSKPELVAPSLHVVAPVLPGTPLAAEARALFELRSRGDATGEARLAELKLVTPYYQHVEGTSFAAPVAAAVAATLLEANPALAPARLRELLLASAHRVPGAPLERQGAGALDAGRAVALALRDRHTRESELGRTPLTHDGCVRFLLHDHAAGRVRLYGSWDGWGAGVEARAVEPGLWEARLARPAPGSYGYKFRLDEARWLDDPANPRRAHDGHGGFNSLVAIQRADE